MDTNYHCEFIRAPLSSRVPDTREKNYIVLSKTIVLNIDMLIDFKEQTVLKICKEMI